MIHTKLSRLRILFLTLILVGCGQAAEAPVSSAAATVTPTPEPHPVTTDFHSVQARGETIGRLLVQQDYEALSALFSQDSSQAHTAADLKKMVTDFLGQDAFTGTSAAYARMDRGLITTWTYLNGTQDTYVVRTRLDDSRTIVQMQLSTAPEAIVTEDGDTWTETLVTIGRDPSVQGILTLPVSGGNFPVAILMGESLEDGADASGSDATFRKELAHILAAEGIATLRYDMRLYEDPLSLAMDGPSLRLQLEEDLAWAVHHLENQPVNALNMYYIGCGTLGTLGYAFMHEHYEITGGLVLLEAPYAESGTALMARYYGLDETLATQAAEALAQEDPDLSQTVGPYYLSYWQSWEELNPLTYTPLVAEPILILQSEQDDAVTMTEDYAGWKTQAGSNVTMISYEDLDDHLRDEEGSLETLGQEIAAWING
jgi:hypothetical protein